MIKRRVQQLARRLFETSEALLLQDWRRYRRPEERHLQRLLATLDIDCVFDVGANSGQYASMLRDYCNYKGLIISFEPTPSLVESLKVSARADPLWQIEAVALGRTESEMVFRTWKQSQSNSFLPLTPNAGDSISNCDATEIKVRVRTLDAMFGDLQVKFGFKRPFLKMDTQGYDLEVFAGGRTIIETFLGLQSELSIQPYYAGAPDWHESLATYTSAGFIMSAVIENNGHQFPELHELDCIMIRKV